MVVLADGYGLVCFLARLSLNLTVLLFASVSFSSFSAASAVGAVAAVAVPHLLAVAIETAVVVALLMEGAGSDSVSIRTAVPAAAVVVLPVVLVPVAFCGDYPSLAPPAAVACVFAIAVVAVVVAAVEHTWVELSLEMQWG